MGIICPKIRQYMVRAEGATYVMYWMKLTERLKGEFIRRIKW
jgi:hypothetical protein